MKKNAKRTLSLVLCLALLVAAVPTFVFAAGSASITIDASSYSAGVDTTSVTSVSLPIKVEATNVNAANWTLTYDTDVFESASVALESGIAGELDEINAQNVIFWEADDVQTISGKFITLTLVLKSGAKTGDTTVSISGTMTDDDYEDIDVSASTTLNITDGTSGGDTNTGISLTAAATNDNPVRVGASNPIKVNVGVGQAYAAAEMTITYPSSLVSFDEDNSTLGTATITDDGKGTLKLADYGDDKEVGTANYVLAFTVVASSAGTAEFKVTKAGLGTGTSAVDANLTAVADADLGSASIAIENAQYTVTLPNDGLFYADTTVVEAGGTFTFYPEQTTGGYYDYELPTATYADSSSATVTETTDGTGWQITNVTGNVTIGAGSRTPKSYGNITYTGTGADKVTGQTDTATYLTDIDFTIPADVAAGTENGVEYSVAAVIGTSNHTFGTPATNDDGSRTYTIPGTSVTGAVTITVTATTLEANKVTVSIGGNSSSDGSFEDTDAGASVQVDKTTGSATLTVDTKSGLNKGYNYEVTTSAGTLTENADGTYTITGLTSDATITINRTINVDGVKNQVEINGESKSFVTLDSTAGTKMWLIQLPNHVENTATADYYYDGQQMYWSADHDNYILVVIADEAPAITADKFTLREVTATPTVASNYWDVNKSGTVDANDAQLIWNMYKSVYTAFSTAADGTGATVEKFMLADANHDGVLSTDDAVVIINQILGITT